MEWRGWPVHVESAGEIDRSREAAPMVLLHGFGSGSFTWRPALAAGLGAGRWVLAFDRIGFGQSARPRAGTWNEEDGNPYSLDAAVELTSALVDHHRLGGDDDDDDDDGGLVLVGHSAGALVATAFTASTPARVRALVLVAPAVVAAGPPPPVAAAFRLPGARQWAPALLRAGRPFMGRAVATAWHDPAALRTSGLGADYDRSTTADGWAEGLVELTLATAAAGPFDADKALSAIRRAAIPTLVVAGAHDRTIKAESWLHVAKATDASVEVIAGAGHVPHEERPAEFVAAVERFLTGVE